MKYLIWLLWVSCAVLIVCGAVGFIASQNHVVSDAKTCANVYADTCAALPITQEIGAAGWALIFLSGFGCGWLANKLK